MSQVFKHDCLDMRCLLLYLYLITLDLYVLIVYLRLRFDKVRHFFLLLPASGNVTITWFCMIFIPFELESCIRCMCQVVPRNFRKTTRENTENFFFGFLDEACCADDQPLFQFGDSLQKYHQVYYIRCWVFSQVQKEQRIWQVFFFSQSKWFP